MRILTSGLIWRRAKVWGYRLSSSFHSTGVGEKSADEGEGGGGVAQTGNRGVAAKGGCSSSWHGLKGRAPLSGVWDAWP